MNTLHDVVVSTTLSAATYVSSSLPAVVNGGSYQWQLGAIAPGASASFAVTVTPPGSSALFTDLDSGAAAAGIVGRVHGIIFDRPTTGP